MKYDDLVDRRMHVQRLWGRPFAKAEDALRWLTAIQAQEYPFAKWSLAQRAGDSTDIEVERAFAEGAILRTHVLRPTWHFVLPEDLRWIAKASAPRVHALNKHYYRKLELDDKLLAKAEASIVRALEGGMQRTRNELAEALAEKGIVASGPRLAYIVMHAELEALVCSGAPRKKQHTYALVDERVPKVRALDREEALAELTRRYFTSRGPATLEDYLRWSSLTVGEGKRGIAMVESQLERETIEGLTYWLGPASSSVRTSRPAKGPTVDLVQGYDEYVMSYFESRPPAHATVASATRSSTGARPMYTHAILLDGRLVGHWRPLAAKAAVAIETTFYRPLTRPEARALDAAIERYGHFLALPAAPTGVSKLTRPL